MVDEMQKPPSPPNIGMSWPFLSRIIFLSSRILESIPVGSAGIGMYWCMPNAVIQSARPSSKSLRWYCILLNAESIGPHITPSGSSSVMIP